MAQSMSSVTASNFTMVEYRDPPFETRMKSLITGAEAQPLPGGLYFIKKLKLELYSESGELQMVVEAPQCVYDGAEREARSPGYFKARSGDGQYHVEGEGFLWRQDASTLTISNQVHTIIREAAQKTNEK
jgi:hypothetical protein